MQVCQDVVLPETTDVGLRLLFIEGGSAKVESSQFSVAPALAMLPLTLEARKKPELILRMGLYRAKILLHEADLIRVGGREAIRDLEVVENKIPSCFINLLLRIILLLRG